MVLASAAFSSSSGLRVAGRVQQDDAGTPLTCTEYASHQALRVLAVTHRPLPAARRPFLFLVPFYRQTQVSCGDMEELVQGQGNTDVGAGTLARPVGSHDSADQAGRTALLVLCEFCRTFISCSIEKQQNQSPLRHQISVENARRLHSPSARATGHSESSKALGRAGLVAPGALFVRGP